MKRHLLIFAYSISLILLMACCNTGQTVNNINSPELDSLSGRYDSPFNKHGISFGSVDVKYKSKRIIYFEIETGHQGGCIGKLSGELTIDSILTGAYLTDVGTEIRFEFSNNRLHIIELEDCQEHGMRCWFGGLYEKVVFKLKNAKI